MAQNTLGRNITFPIYYDDNGTRRSFHDLVMLKSTYESIVMSLGDKVTGDVYYKDNTLAFSMKEYILVDNVKYFIVNPPTIVREGIASENSQLKGMTKYSLVFYHPMYKLGNFPFTDIAVTNDEEVYLSQNKTFSWIGTLFDFVAKLNANLANSEWVVISNITQGSDMYEKAHKQSEVLTFDKQFISDALKAAYETWDIPFVISPTTQVVNGVQKSFKIEFGLPVEDIYTTNDQNQQVPFVFQFGQGVGLKNNSRTPRNNKIVTRIIGEGSERNIPYGYPQIRWYGSASAEFTYGNRAGVFTNVDVVVDGVTHHLSKMVSYPIYKGILGGQYVQLIKHPFTRKKLMPKEYHESVYNKICYINSDGTFNTNYNPDIEIVDYIDAIGSTYAHEINPASPSAEMHTFEDIKPELLVNENIGFIDVYPINDSDMRRASGWDESIDDEGNYKQGYFKVKLPRLQFDLYACAAITESMQINIKSGACLGCTFDVEVDWEDYKNNFYKADGSFDPVIHTATGDGHRRDGSKYPDSSQGQIEIILKKDTETFGTLMPNMYQYPKGESSTGANDGDNFVVLGISLPESYIQSAEIKLSFEMELYMKDNNNYYYDYPLKFDEYFLATHTDILSQISNNKKVRFNYGGREIELYIKQITIKYGESPLPKYDIVLTDNIEVVLNQIGQAVGEMRAISNTFFVANSDMRRELTRIENRVADKEKHGDIHRFYYYAGEWRDDNTQGSIVTDLEAPFFSYTDGQGNVSYWVFNPQETGMYSWSEMGVPHEGTTSSPSAWARMESDLKYLITEAIFSNYAQFGSAIINGDWLLSMNGTIDGVLYENGALYGGMPAYTYFNPSDPTGMNTQHVFVPNYCVDLRVGDSFMRNALIRGGVRSPFKFAESGIIYNGQPAPTSPDSPSYFTDNVSVHSQAGIGSIYYLPWDISQSGRRMIIANFKYGSHSSVVTGTADFHAPTGQYFFEDGLQKTDISISREVIELLGYGDSTQFYGWIVLKRTDLGSVHGYGHPSKCLAMGRVTLNDNNSPRIFYKSFDGTELSCVRNSEGVYTLSWDNNNWFVDSSSPFVMVCGYGYIQGASHSHYASVVSQTTTSVTIQTADDDSPNDGGFNFYIMNIDDWNYLQG